MKVKIGKKQNGEDHVEDLHESKLNLIYKGHGLECTPVELLDDHVVVDCALTLEYARKYITMDEQVTLFRTSSIHRRLFDLVFNNETGTNLNLEPPVDLFDFRAAGSGVQHVMVLIMMMIHACATQKLTGKKIYLKNHPEAYLHPAIQANLSDMFIKLMNGFRNKQEEVFDEY